MDTTSDVVVGQLQSLSTANTAGSVQSTEQDRGQNAADSSISIHVLKSVPNRLAHGENDDLRRRLFQAGGHLKESRDFARWLAEHDQKRAGKLRDCAGFLMFRQFVKLGVVKLAGGVFCRQPLLCGFCAAGRASRQVATLGDKFDQVRTAHPFLKPYMVTLTIRSQPSLAPMLKTFWGCWSKMVQRRANAIKGKNGSVMGLMAGGFIAGEAKRGEGGGWHYHAHGVFLADVDRYQPVWERLVREWADVAGQSWASVQFQPVRGDLRSDTLRECLKYASKWEPGQFADRLEAANALAGVRRVRTFGNLYGVKLPEDVTDDLTGLDAEEYIERVFRYGSAGYAEIFPDAAKRKLLNGN